MAAAGAGKVIRGSEAWLKQPTRLHEWHPQCPWLLKARYSLVQQYPLFRCLCACNSVLLMPYVVPISGYLYNNVMEHHENLLKYENEVILEGQANSGGPQI